jgi:signal transduction histidine kinase
MTPPDAPAGSPQRRNPTVTRLRKDASRILRQWEQRVRQAAPPTRRDESPALLDRMPAILEEIRRALSRASAPRRERSGEPIAPDQDRQPARHGEYSLDQLLLEYSLLRSVLLEVLEEAGAMPAPDRDIILDRIESAMREAAADFAHGQQETLRQADRRKNELLIMLGHELRTPLAAIGNAVYILEQIGAGDERAARQRAIISRQAAHVVRLVDDLLNVSRIATGKIELRIETVDLRHVVEDALAACRPFVEDSEHALSTALPQSPVLIQGDPDRLIQIVANLLNNAARYTDPGGRIWIALGGEQGEAVLRVRDTGIGIDPEMLPFIFDMFTQADTTPRSRGGLGVGLSLARRLVELHGGRVTAHSDGPGQGSEFIVRLPLHTGA